MHLRSVLLSLLVVGGFASTALATSVGVGQLTFDLDTIGPTSTAFDVTNLTGTTSSAPSFPITTPLTFTITNLVATVLGGTTYTISGANFTPVGSTGDLSCSVSGDAASGGCDFSKYEVLSATLTGTLSPTSPIDGLPFGNTILANFSTTMTPSDCAGPSSTSSSEVAAAVDPLTPGCAATIFASTPPVPTAVPEPETLPLVTIGLLGVAALRSLRS